MAREQFPYPCDCVAIDCFLQHKSYEDADTLVSKDGTLKVIDQVCCYYDPLGNLMGTVTTESWTSIYAMHTINYIAELMGSEDRVTREVRGVASDSEQHDRDVKPLWFYGTQNITMGVPFVITGQLGVLAWRAKS